MKKYAVIALLVLIVGGGIYVATKKSPESPALMEKTTFPNDTTEPKAVSQKDATVESTTKTITMKEIASHNTAKDCWFAVDGKVYDVTDYVSSGKHPGGNVIVAGCGKDATDMFNSRGGKGPHPEKAVSYLSTMEIGMLAN